MCIYAFIILPSDTSANARETLPAMRENTAPLRHFRKRTGDPELLAPVQMDMETLPQTHGRPVQGDQQRPGVLDTSANARETPFR